MKCFWPACSNRVRCLGFGSCVALHQRANLADFPMTADNVASIRETSRNRAVEESVGLFREVIIGVLCQRAGEGMIRCTQITPLADQHAQAFRRLLLERLAPREAATVGALGALKAVDALWERDAGLGFEKEMGLGTPVGEVWGKVREAIASIEGRS